MYQKSQRVMIVAFTLPAILCFALVYAYPVARTFLMSFFNINNIVSKMKDWVFVGVDNFTGLFSANLFRTSLVNVFRIWFFGGIAINILAITFAVILTSGVRLKSFFRAAIYLPNIISAVALANMWIHYAFNTRYGLFHNLFSALGLNTLAAYQWTSADNIFSSMLLAFCFGAVGYYMLIYISGIEKIPGDLYESAMLEGSSVVHSFFTITVPLLRGVFKTTLTFWTTGALGFYVWSLMFTGPGTPKPGVMTPVYYMLRTVFGEANTADVPLNAGRGAAVCVVIMAIALVVFGAINLFLKDDEVTF